MPHNTGMACLKAWRVVVATLVAGMLVAGCFSVIVVAVLIAGKCRYRRSLAAAPAARCHDDDATQNHGAHCRHEMRLRSASTESRRKLSGRNS